MCRLALQFPITTRFDLGLPTGYLQVSKILMNIILRGIRNRGSRPLAALARLSLQPHQVRSIGRRRQVSSNLHIIMKNKSLAALRAACASNTHKFERLKLALMVALLGMSPMAATANQVVNGGFETGNLSAWTTSGADYATVDTSGPHSGNYLFVGFDNAGFATLSQVLSTTPATAYSFSFFSFANFSHPGNILRYQFDSGPIVSVTQTSGWAQTLGGFIASGPSTQLNFYFETDNGTGTWQIDDVSVEAVSTPDGGSTLALLGLTMTAVAGARRKFAV